MSLEVSPTSTSVSLLTPELVAVASDPLRSLDERLEAYEDLIDSMKRLSESRRRKLSAPT